MTASRNSPRQTFLAKTLFGLETVLSDELGQLGAGDITPFTRAVQFSGDTGMLYRANLLLRTATRILAPLRSFTAKDKNTLYQGVSSVDWDEHMDADSTFVIDTVCNASAFDNSLFVAQRAKDAIVDQFRNKYSRRPSVDLKNPDIRINLYLNKDEATLALDSSGAPLHKRGYRLDYGAAPLNEVLAAGIIRLCGWDGADRLVDPMCGSGTLLIEAAMLRAGIPPTEARKEFAFMRWKNFDRTLFDNIQKTIDADACSRSNNKPAHMVLGCDIDKSRLAQARLNAERAGVADLIHFEKADFFNNDPPAGPGTLVMNPPYGERLPIAEAEAFYRALGDTLKQKYAGYRAFILTGNLKAAKKLGIRSSARTILYNGPIECRLLEYEMYSGSRKPANTSSAT